MSKKPDPIFCCLGCGRDTTSVSELCWQCRRSAPPRFTKEMKDRSVVNSNLIGAAAEGMGFGDLPEEGRPRQHWLQREN